MRWKSRSIPDAAEPDQNGEGILRPGSSLGNVSLGGFQLAGSGPGGSGPGDSGLSRISGPSGGRSGDGKPNPHTSLAAHGDPPESSNSLPENSDLAQPSGTDGVPEDMATLVLDKPALGAGSASSSNAHRDAYKGIDYGADESSDAAIMLRVAAGDESSFNFLAEKYHRAMIHFLFRMVRNQAVAEELAQEVFLRVYRSRESYRAEAKFTTWLYRIATNLAVNHARDTRHERTAQTVYLDVPDEETGTTPDVADDEPSVEQRLLRDERMAAIRKHVMALPERQRMAVLMHKYQGMDYKQIGDVLKLSESATKSLLFRAYQTLRDKLKDFV
jgi:RNA polymerase sigma-70 factor (ECF subfamily)